MECFFALPADNSCNSDRKFMLVLMVVFVEFCYDLVVNKKYNYEYIIKINVSGLVYGKSVGAELSLWLWIGRTKEVRASGDRGDPGGHRRLTAIEGWVYTRPCRAGMKTFYFVYLLT